MTNQPRLAYGRECREPASRAACLALLLAVFTLGLALRLYALDADSLWLDEIFTATTSQLDLRSIPQFLATSDSHPPLHFLIAKLGATLWGGSEFALRLPAVLLGAASVLLIYKVGQIMWGPKEGLMAAFLLSVDAYHIRYSQEARNYSPMVFLALLSLIFLLLALHRGQKRMWFLFAVCASLNLYTHNFAFLVLASEALFAAWVVVESWLLSTNRRLRASLEIGTAAAAQNQRLASKYLSSPPDVGAASKQAVSLVGALALVGALYLPWLPFLQQQVFGRVIRFTGLGFGEPRGAQFSISFFTDAFAAYTGVRGAILLLFLVLFAIGLASSRARYIALSVFWILPPLVFPFIARSGHFYSLRHTICVLPLLLLPMARGISVLIDWLTQLLPLARGHRHRSLAVVSIVTVFVLGASSVAPIKAYYLMQKTDYRAVASYLEHRLHPGDVILVDSLAYATGIDAHWTKHCLSYYIGAVRLEQTPVLAVERGLWANLQSRDQPRGEVVAVVARRLRPRSWDHQTDVSVVDFEDLSVIQLRQPSGYVPQDGKAMLVALLGLLQGSDSSFNARLALAETYGQMGMLSEAASQVVLASRDMPGGQSAPDDLAQTISQLQPYVYVQTENATVGDSLSLLGYSRQPTAVQAGDVITVTLWWETRDHMDIDYTGFVHVMGPDGRIVVQDDRLLQSRARTTSRWRVGEVVTDEHALEMPPNAQPGPYTVLVGVYYWETGERLPVWDEEGAGAADDAIILELLTL